MRYGRNWDRYGDSYGYPPYVPVAERRAKAAAHAKKLEQKRGRPLSPILIEGRTIAKSFWGKAWCDNLEAYSDFANRLPRGRTYARNGSVIDLEIAKGKITAMVSGSEIYELTITIETVPPKSWQSIQRDCANSIASLIDLLQGRFDRGVMERLTQKDNGLFPKPKEIKLQCSCPDYAGMCKHLAAVMYGVGARLDQSPELLFTLRHVDHLELISQAVAGKNLERAFAGDTADNLQADDLGQMFGIELESNDSAPTKQSATKARRKSSQTTKPRRPTSAKSQSKPTAVSKRAQTAVLAAKAPAQPARTKTSVATLAAKVKAKPPRPPKKAVATSPRARRAR